ncbi:MAG: hypothetical protein E6J91_09650 [Deltaproteobacteria bacterium]|nr:MAG: hypothetical protein E6J91_09650 [Deltaproteobacteria bacterium]
MPTQTLPTIDPSELTRVSGGTTSNDQITAALTQITSSLSSLSNSNKSQMDPTMMMMMMMMMGGFGGGGGGVVAAGAPVGAASPPVINVDTSVLSRGGVPGWGALGGGGGGGCGSKKGW